MRWQNSEKKKESNEFDSTEFQKIVYGLANVKKEIDYMQKIYSPGKLTQIDNALKKVHANVFEIEVMKMNQDNLAKKADVDRLENRFGDYCPMHKFKDISDDLKDAVKKEEYDIAMRELEYLKKDCARLCPKDEFLTRLHTFNSDMNSKL